MGLNSSEFTNFEAVRNIFKNISFHDDTMNILF